MVHKVKSWLFPVLVLVAVSLFVVSGCTVLPEDGTGNQSDGTPAPQLPQPKTLTDPREIELNTVIQKAAAGREDVMAFVVFRVVVDHVDFSPDGNLALVWTAMVDPQTGEVQSAELGLVIARKTTNPDQPWQTYFQADPGFAEQLTSIPESMLSAEIKAQYMPAIQQEPKDPVIYRGYRLPWTNGEPVRVTGSIGHVYTYKSCPSTCLYAFDFANGGMFAVRAARRGSVKYVVWGYPNGNTTNANYIVLEDTSTIPTTYQVYLHFAQNTIPVALRVIGAEVVQGQFLGNADDTGYSSGNHLHFHVHTNPTSYWGNSVDIVFDEVTTNGGRPRTCVEADRFPQFGSQCMPGNVYISQNSDSEPPTGGITNPVPYTTFTSPTLNVSGWMRDDVGVQSGQLLYNTGGDWIPIGSPLTTSPFTQEINVCDSRIPDGKVFLSIKVLDQAGKVSEGTQGLTELEKKYTCPPLPPACTPTLNQAALYMEKDYQGKCQVVNLGDIPNLDNLTLPMLDKTVSLQVGAGVSVLLYPDPGFGGTPEFFQDGDANLADNPIGAANAASIRVVNRITPPQPPVLKMPDVFIASQELTLEWELPENADTRSTLTGPDGYSNILEWQSGGTWAVGKLKEGTYQWTVKAKNLAGTAKTTQEFSVEPAILLPATHLEALPLIVNSTAVLLKWQVDAGADGIDHFNLQVRNPDGEWIDWGGNLAKDARQVLFWGDAGDTYEFRMRAVDLIGNAEEYPTLPEITTTMSGPCGDDLFEGSAPGDDEQPTSAPMELNTSQTHNWCPVGDVDWVVFKVKAGDQLKFTTKTVDLAAGALLQLYDQDGVTFLGEARPKNESAGAFLDWTAPLDGVYTARLSPVDTRIGGSDTRYILDISAKSTVKPGTLICGSVTIPAILGGAYVASKKLKKKKPKGVGW
jgi:murein DD-endopeptidase MepM/ murein hydrolase activator NlpD